MSELEYTDKIMYSFKELIPLQLENEIFGRIFDTIQRVHLCDLNQKHIYDKPITWTEFHSDLIAGYILTKI